MNAERDLARVLDDMRTARERLLATVVPLSPADLRIVRPGGWSAGRVLEHVIESEFTYVRLLAHQCGKVAPQCDTSEPGDGAAAAAALAATRGAVEAMIEEITPDTLYRMVQFGREEYSPLSVLENVTAHDREHVEQIEALLHHRDPGVVRPIVVPEGVSVRTATEADLPRITEIYNHYVLHTPITFDLEPYTVETRRPWFPQFAPSGRHRLLVAESDGKLLAYAGTHQFRTKAAYDTTVETTIYCAPDATGRGVGSAMYDALFDTLRDEDIHAFIAGITLPNDVSVALHERFGFRPAGVMHDVGFKFGRYWDVGWYERLAP